MVDWNEIATKKNAEIERLRLQDEAAEVRRHEAKPRLAAAVSALFDRIADEIETQHNSRSGPDQRITIDRTTTSLSCRKDAEPRGTLELNYVEPPEPDRAGELHAKAAGTDAYRKRQGEDVVKFSIWLTADGSLTGKQTSGHGASEAMLSVDQIADRTLRTFVWYIS